MLRLLLAIILALTFPLQAEAPAARVLHIPNPPPVYRLMQCEVTAYSWECGSGTGFTATGTRPHVGTVAVDPKVIPYGTHVFIPGYGHGVAEDCGGAVKGNVIDVFMDSTEEAIIWGRKKLEVKVYDVD